MKTDTAHPLRRAHAQAPALLCHLSCVGAIAAYLLIERANSTVHCLGLFSFL
ncbi:MAG: hypothetical protein V4754_21930 [Pseudomonadota bacterium]